MESLPLREQRSQLVPRLSVDSSPTAGRSEHSREGQRPKEYCPGKSYSCEGRSRTRVRCVVSLVESPPCITWPVERTSHRRRPRPQPTRRSISTVYERQSASLEQ